MLHLNLIDFDPSPANTTGQTGTIIGEPADFYHGLPHISNSKLSEFKEKGPRGFRRSHITKEDPRRTTKALDGGDIAHHLILMGDFFFYERFAIEPSGNDVPKRPSKTQLNAKKPSPETIYAIDFWTRWDDANKGKTSIGFDEYETACKARDGIMENPDAKALLDAVAHTEITFRTGIMPHLGYQIQCKFDRILPLGVELPTDRMALREGEPVVIDLKTCASLEQFRRCFEDKNYYRQAGFYLETARAVLGCGVLDQWLFLAVEVNPPYEAAVFMPSQQAIRAGKDEVSKDLLSLARCYETGNWPLRFPGVANIDLPAWYYKQHGIEMVG